MQSDRVYEVLGAIQEESMQGIGPDELSFLEKTGLVRVVKMVDRAAIEKEMRGTNGTSRQLEKARGKLQELKIEKGKIEKKCSGWMYRKFSTFKGSEEERELKKVNRKITTAQEKVEQLMSELARVRTLSETLEFLQGRDSDYRTITEEGLRVYRLMEPAIERLASLDFQAFIS